MAIYTVPSDESAATSVYLVYRHTWAASPELDMSASVSFSYRETSACVMKWLSERMCLRASPFPC